MAALTERKRRTYGSGSVYQRASDGRWCGTIEHGYTATGGRRRITVTGVSEAQVKARLKDKLRALARDESPSSRVTVKAWADDWLAIREQKVRPSTYNVDRTAVRRWVVPTIGHRRIEQLTPGDIRAVADAVRSEGANTTTAGRYAATLHKLLEDAEKEGHPVPARVLKVEPPAPAVHDRGSIPIPDALAMLQVAADLPHGSRWLAAFMQGMRGAEYLGLPWEEVDLDAETLTVAWQLKALPYRVARDRASGFRVPDGFEARHLVDSLHLVRPKSKAGWRVIPLVPILADALRRWQAVGPPSPHGLVWPAADGRPASAEQDVVEWQAIQDTADVHHASGRWYKRHEARHTTATLLMELGVPEPVRVAIMGHSTIASTRGYEHVDVTMARAALARVAERLELG